MMTTRNLIEALRKANPDDPVDEQRVRAALRWGGVPAPSLFAGRLAWTASEARALAEHLGLRLPCDVGSENGSPQGPRRIDREESGAEVRDVP